MCYNELGTPKAKLEKVKVKLQNGEVVYGDKFDQNDFATLKEIFAEWLEINKKVTSLGGRGLNVPDVFSEALYCIFFNAVRTNNTAHSYDCVNLDNGAGVQVKSASIANDCTSFGPRSTWNELYFMDFAVNGKIDGIIDVYRLDFALDDVILNTKKNETFKMQQEQGRRPRLSLKKLIKEKNIKPIKRISLID